MASQCPQQGEYGIDMQKKEGGGASASSDALLVAALRPPRPVFVLRGGACPLAPAAALVSRPLW
jgi:hypothetical protein